MMPLVHFICSDAETTFEHQRVKPEVAEPKESSSQTSEPKESSGQSSKQGQSATGDK